MKCESGETFFTEEQGLSRLSITGSGEPTSCALAAVKELLPDGPADFKENGLIFCTLGVLCCCFFLALLLQRERERHGKLIGVTLVYKLQLIGVNFLHDCMEKLNVNL